MNDEPMGSGEGPSGLAEILTFVPETLPNGMVSIAIRAHGSKGNTLRDVDAHYGFYLSAENARKFGLQLAQEGNNSREDFINKSRISQRYE